MSLEEARKDNVKEILAYHRDNQSVSFIAGMVNVSQSFVKQVIKEHKARNKTMQTPTTKEQAEIYLTDYLRNPDVTFNDLMFIVRNACMLKADRMRLCGFESRADQWEENAQKLVDNIT